MDGKAGDKFFIIRSIDRLTAFRSEHALFHLTRPTVRVIKLTPPFGFHVCCDVSRTITLLAITQIKNGSLDSWNAEHLHEQVHLGDGIVVVKGNNSIGKTLLEELRTVLGEAEFTFLCYSVLTGCEDFCLRKAKRHQIPAGGRINSLYGEACDKFSITRSIDRWAMSYNSFGQHFYPKYISPA